MSHCVKYINETICEIIQEIIDTWLIILKCCFIILIFSHLHIFILVHVLFNVRIFYFKMFLFQSLMVFSPLTLLFHARYFMSHFIMSLFIDEFPDKLARRRGSENVLPQCHDSLHMDFSVFGNKSTCWKPVKLQFKCKFVHDTHPCISKTFL